MDVDRDRTYGCLSHDPVEIVNTFGGQWSTTRFEAGDVILFGMFTMHASLTNVSDRWRISCDTRFQPADEPADPRWVGEKPGPDIALRAIKLKSIEQARAQWNL